MTNNYLDKQNSYRVPEQTPTGITQKFIDISDDSTKRKLQFLSETDKQMLLQKNNDEDYIVVS